MVREGRVTCVTFTVSTSVIVRGPAVTTLHACLAEGTTAGGRQSFADAAFNLVISRDLPDRKELAETQHLAETTTATWRKRDRHYAARLKQHDVVIDCGTQAELAADDFKGKQLEVRACTLTPTWRWWLLRQGCSELCTV